VNSDQRMRDLYQQRIDGCNHGFLDDDLNMHDCVSDAAFRYDINYQMIEKSQTMVELARQYAATNSTTLTKFAIMETAFYSGAVAAVETKWDGEENITCPLLTKEHHSMKPWKRIELEAKLTALTKAIDALGYDVEILYDQDHPYYKLTKR